jgi:transcriptional regulator with XRE-family HTH domain
MPKTPEPSLSMNQIVASNLARARRLRGWTQAETVKQLDQRAGVQTTVVNLSAYERSVDGKRRREFDADDLLAYARTFQLPITWFLLPPDPTQPKLSTEDHPDGRAPTLVLDWLYRESSEEHERLAELTENLEAPTDYQRDLQERARRYASQLAAAALAQHNTTPQALRALADAVEQAQAQARGSSTA